MDYQSQNGSTILPKYSDVMKQLAQGYHFNSWKTRMYLFPFTHMSKMYNNLYVVFWIISLKNYNESSLEIYYEEKRHSCVGQTRIILKIMATKKKSYTTIQNFIFKWEDIRNDGKNFPRTGRILNQWGKVFLISPFSCQIPSFF